MRYKKWHGLPALNIIIKKKNNLTSLARHTGIIGMGTQPAAPPCKGAVAQEALVPVASDVCHQHVARAVAKEAVSEGPVGPVEAQLSADDAGVSRAPTVVADSSPLAVEQDFDPPLRLRGPAHKSDRILI